jgi:hypothetical protein
VKSSSGEGGGGSQFGRRERKPGTLYTYSVVPMVLYCTSYGLLTACQQRSYLVLSVQNNVFV